MNTCSPSQLPFHFVCFFEQLANTTSRVSVSMQGTGPTSKDATLLTALNHPKAAIVRNRQFIISDKDWSSVNKEDNTLGVYPAKSLLHGTQFHLFGSRRSKASYNEFDIPKQARCSYIDGFRG